MKSKLALKIKKLFRRKKNRNIVYLEKEIIRKDKIIIEMKKKNQLLLKTIMKQSEETLDLKKKINELHNRLK